MNPTQKQTRFPVKDARQPVLGVLDFLGSLLIALLPQIAGVLARFVSKSATLAPSGGFCAPAANPGHGVFTGFALAI